MKRSKAIAVTMSTFLLAMVAATSLAPWMWSPLQNYEVVRSNFQSLDAEAWMNAANVRFPRDETAVNLSGLIASTQAVDINDVCALLLFVQSEIVSDALRGNLFTRFPDGLRISFRFPAILFSHYSFAYIITGKDINDDHASIGVSMVSPDEVFSVNRIGRDMQSADITDLISAKTITIRLYRTQRLVGVFPEWWSRPTVDDLAGRANVECVFSIRVPVWTRQ